MLSSTHWHNFLFTFLFGRNTYIYIYRYTHTHTHTHMKHYIYTNKQTKNSHALHVPISKTHHHQRLTVSTKTTSFRINKVPPTPTYYFFSHGPTAPDGPKPPHCWCFQITLSYTTFTRTPLDEWSARHWDLYLTAHKNRNRVMPPAGFEPAISASEQPQTHALGRATTEVGSRMN